MSNIWEDPSLQRRPEPPRDRYGRYLITPAGEDKPVPHTRATTVASAVKDGYGLTGWKMRSTAVGVARRPDLAPIFANGDITDRALDEFVEQAMDAAGANDRRDIGTAIHRAIEPWHRGGQVGPAPAGFERDVEAYVSALTSAGLTVVPGLVEQIVVLSGLNEPIAGTADFGLNHDSWALPRIADLKTGKSVSYPHEWAVQLAIYANAQTTWDMATNVHTPMPAVDRRVAMIVHLPVGEGVCSIYELDIAAGWAAVDLALAVRQFQKAKSLVTKVAEHQVTAPPTVIPLTVAPTPAPVVDLLAPPPPPEPRPVGALEAAARQDRIDHLRGRLVALLDAHGAHATNLVATARPDWLPTFADEREHPGTLDATHLDEWAKIITNAEAAVGQPFTSDPDPAGPLLRDDDRIADLRARVQALPADLREQVQDDAEAAGVPKLTSGKATVTHLDQVAALIDAAEATARQRAMIAVTHMAALPDSVTSAWVGATIGAPCDEHGVLYGNLLTDVQLEHLGDLADACLPEAGPLLVADGDGLAAHPDALDLLVARFGGKSPLLAEAKRLAGALGIDKPKASTDVVASIPLVARLAVTDVAA